MDVRDSSAAQFRFPLPGALRRGVLEPVAYDAECVFYPVCLYPAGREPARNDKKAAQHHDRISAQRNLARGRVVVCAVGSGSRADAVSRQSRVGAVSQRVSGRGGAVLPEAVFLYLQRKRVEADRTDTCIVELPAAAHRGADVRSRGASGLVSGAVRTAAFGGGRALLRQKCI